MHKILDSIKQVIDASKSITINKENIKYFCNNNNIKNDIHWLGFSPLNLKSLNFQEQLRFLIILDSISFCFWKLPKWRIEYRNRYFDGSWGMVAALTKAFDKGIPILDFNFLKNLTLKEFNSIVEDETKLVLKEERVKTLNEVANKIIDNFNSEPEILISKSDNDAIKIQELILTTFTSFEDIAVYNNDKIYFNKRAQLLAADINYILELNKKPSLSNIDKITACADYKIPFILREFGILEYDSHLRSIVDNRIIIEKGTKEEIEIRAHAIWAIELLKKEYEKKNVEIRSVQINDYLWLLSQIKNPNNKPYHLTLTTSY
jgi:hypothetical protein